MAKILIIDDDRVICRCLAEVARLGGYEAEVALDGKRGSETARWFQPQLIFVDLLMPGRAGLETIVALRRELPAVKLVAMTGQPLVGDVSLLNLAQHFGADRVLAKPFAIAQVLSLMSELLNVPPGDVVAAPI